MRNVVIDGLHPIDWKFDIIFDTYCSFADVIDISIDSDSKRRGYIIVGLCEHILRLVIFFCNRYLPRYFYSLLSTAILIYICFLFNRPTYQHLSYYRVMVLR